MTHAYVQVTIAAGFSGRPTKTALREALRSNPEGMIFKVESQFHGPGDLVNGHQALNRGWTLEVHTPEGASVAMIDFNGNGPAPDHLQAVVR